MNNIEIELRYKVLNQEQLTRFLEPAICRGTKRIVDVYFDTPDRMLWRRGIFIRKRDDKTLDIKFNRECLADASLPLLAYCEEHSFALPLRTEDAVRLNELLVSLDLKPAMQADLSAVCDINSLTPHYVVDKTRTTYSYGAFTIGLDELAGLGTFLEIELMAASIDELELVKQEMQLVLYGLALEPIKQGYGSLAVQHQDPSWYQVGRFIVKDV